MALLTIDDLGTILSVWAHPDDEGYGCGAIMAGAVARGQRVVCVTATRGEQGSTDRQRWPNGDALAEVRTRELSESLATLGVTEHHWLDYPDGGCADVPAAEAVDRLRAIVQAVQPDSVLTFGPDGGTRHPDHMAVSRWTTAATAGTKARVFHATNTPEWTQRMFTLVDPAMIMMGEGTPPSHTPEQCALWFHHDGDLLETKYRAMLCQQSQIGPLLGLGGPDFFKEMLAEEAFTDARTE